MPENKQRGESAARVRRFREKMRRQGLKPVTLWLPDVNDPAYLAEIKRQVEVLRNSAHEKEHNDWLDAVQATHDWPPYDG
jgi:hypothetical protein